MQGAIGLADEPRRGLEGGEAGLGDLVGLADGEGQFPVGEVDGTTGGRGVS